MELIVDLGFFFILNLLNLFDFGCVMLKYVLLAFAGLLRLHFYVHYVFVLRRIH